jgi:general secretion pathway protein I
MNGMPSKRCRGFTLLEVLVAFVILALSLGVLLGIFSAGLRNTRLAADYSAAVALAESRLAELGVTSPLVPGIEEGAGAGPFRWRAEVVELDPVDEVGGPGAARLYRVEVEIAWDSLLGPRTVSLATLRLAEAP